MMLLANVNLLLITYKLRETNSMPSTFIIKQTYGYNGRGPKTVYVPVYNFKLAEQ